jgi:hypothetical protein
MKGKLGMQEVLALVYRLQNGPLKYMARHYHLDAASTQLLNLFHSSACRLRTSSWKISPADNFKNYVSMNNGSAL